jgi:hypothetical protein
MPRLVFAAQSVSSSCSLVSCTWRCFSTRSWCRYTQAVHNRPAGAPTDRRGSGASRERRSLGLDWRSAEPPHRLPRRGRRAVRNRLGSWTVRGPMRRFVISVATVAIVVACCATSSSPASSPLPSPSAVASPEVVCDGSQFQPPPSLTCGPAIAAALAVLGPGHPPIIREEFRWGGLCPPGAPCAPPFGNAGIVIVDFVSGPSVFVYVSAEAGGAVAASSPAPYPSGY